MTACCPRHELRESGGCRRHTFAKACGSLFVKHDTHPPWATCTRTASSVEGILASEHLTGVQFVSIRNGERRPRVGERSSRLFLTTGSALSCAGLASRFSSSGRLGTRLHPDAEWVSARPHTLRMTSSSDVFPFHANSRERKY